MRSYGSELLAGNERHKRGTVKFSRSRSVLCLDDGVHGSCFKRLHHPLAVEQDRLTAANKRSPKKRLDASVPGAAASKINLVRHYDSRQILSVLIAQVSPDAKANRGTMVGWQRLTIHAIGEERLRMKGVRHVDTATQHSHDTGCLIGDSRMVRTRRNEPPGGFRRDLTRRPAALQSTRRCETSPHAACK